jgi:hypothetical protein
MGKAIENLEAAQKRALATGSMDVPHSTARH